MNWYFESFIDKLEKAQTKEQCNNLLTLCCEGRNAKGVKVARGCVHCVHCDETRCPVYRQYQVKLIMLDIPETKKTQKDFIVRSRKYKIKAKTQCRQIVLIQITKFRKHFDGDMSLLDEVEELVKKQNFKRARIHANKAGFNKIVETLDKFINGKLGTANSENK